MLQRNTEPAPSNKTNCCPYLGLREDPQTCLGYPAEWNLCYHARPVRPVSLEQQRKLCLSPIYEQCPVFLRERGAPLPKELRGVRDNRRLKWLLLVALVLVSMLSLWAAWQTRTERAIPLIGAVTLPFATRQATTKTSTSVASPAPFAPPEITLTPSPAVLFPTAPRVSATPLPTLVKNCGYELEADIQWNGHALTLHRVRRGENIEILAARYQTSLRAMQAVNYFLPSPLWADLVIVLPVGDLEGEGLPVFEPAPVPEPGVSIALLSEQLSVTPEELIQANDLDRTCELIDGWVLVPHLERKSP